MNTLLGVIYGISYIASSAGETLVVKALNYGSAPLQLPAYTALLSNQLWIFLLPIYVYLLAEKEKTEPSKTNYPLQYTVIGLLTFAITLLRNISVNSMSGSVFSLLISTSILFNMILSCVLLKKNYNRWHILAATFCISSALSIGGTVLFTTQENQSESNFNLGIPTAIGAAFFIALMNVSQEYIQSSWDNYNLRMVEMTLISSLIASGLILIYSITSGEIYKWKTDLIYSTIDKEARIRVIICSLALPILKLIIRNTKYLIIQASNAFFFEFVQAASALLGSVACILIFNEPWGIGYIFAFMLLAISFALYSKAKNILKEDLLKAITTKAVDTVVFENPIGDTIINKQNKVLLHITIWK